jgi:hypothetical protein
MQPRSLTTETSRPIRPGINHGVGLAAFSIKSIPERNSSE